MEKVEQQRYQLACRLGSVATQFPGTDARNGRVACFGLRRARRCVLGLVGSRVLFLLSFVVSDGAGLPAGRGLQSHVLLAAMGRGVSPMFGK